MVVTYVCLLLASPLPLGPSWAGFGRSPATGLGAAVPCPAPLFNYMGCGLLLLLLGARGGIGVGVGTGLGKVSVLAEWSVFLDCSPLLDAVPWGGMKLHLSTNCLDGAMSPRLLLPYWLSMHGPCLGLSLYCALTLRWLVYLLTQAQWSTLGVRALTTAWQQLSLPSSALMRQVGRELNWCSFCAQQPWPVLWTRGGMVLRWSTLPKRISCLTCLPLLENGRAALNS